MIASETHSAQNNVNQSVTIQSAIATAIVPTRPTTRRRGLCFENQSITATLPTKNPMAPRKWGYLEAPS